MTSWKRGIVVEALRQRGLEVAVGPLLRVAPGSRRRAVLTARREGGKIVLGYHRRRSHDLFDLEECPVLQPAIVAQLSGLRAIAAQLAQREIRLTVLLTPNGLDVTADGAGVRLDAQSRRRAGAARGRPTASRASASTARPSSSGRNRRSPWAASTSCRRRARSCRP